MAFRINVAKTTIHVCRTKEEVLALAARLHGHGGTECERTLRSLRIRKLRERVLGGEMRPFTWAVGSVGDFVRRVDGQHSSEMFLGFTPEDWAKIQFPVLVFWEHNDCDTIRDLPDLFEQYNPNWSSRSQEDLVGAHFGIHPELKGLEDRHVNNMLLHGMEWHARGVLGKPKSSHFTLVHDNDDTHDFLLWCGSFLTRHQTAQMLHPAVIAAMWHSFDGSERCRLFWQNVASGCKDNPPETVTYKLAAFLDMLADGTKAEWPRTVAKHFTPKGNAPSAIQVFATCLGAYHADHSGKRVGEVFEPAKGSKAKDVASGFDIMSKKLA